MIREMKSDLREEIIPKHKFFENVDLVKELEKDYNDLRDDFEA